MGLWIISKKLVPNIYTVNMNIFTYVLVHGGTDGMIRFDHLSKEYNGVLAIVGGGVYYMFRKYKRR